MKLVWNWWFTIWTAAFSSNLQKFLTTSLFLLFSYLMSFKFLTCIYSRRYIFFIKELCCILHRLQQSCWLFILLTTKSVCFYYFRHTAWLLQTNRCCWCCWLLPLFLRTSLKRSCFVLTATLLLFLLILPLFKFLCLIHF